MHAPFQNLSVTGTQLALNFYYFMGGWWPSKVVKFILFLVEDKYRMQGFLQIEISSRNVPEVTSTFPGPLHDTKTTEMCSQRKLVRKHRGGAEAEAVHCLGRHYRQRGFAARCPQ